MRILVCIFYSLLISFNLFSQEVNYGAKAGVNISNIIGPVETDDAGNVLESSSYIAGFHIGPTLNYKVSEKSTFALELLFSQKGGKNRFNDTSSYLFLLAPVQDTLLSRSVMVEGAKKQTFVHNIGYLELSGMYYYNLVSNLKIGLGATVGFMLNASGIGETTFNGRLQEGSALIGLDQIIIRHDNRYIRDDLIPDPFGSDTRIQTNEVLVDDNPLLDKLFVPQEVGSYYDFTEKQGSYFNRLDVGANVELRWETDSGLYFGVRGNVGLLDVTNNFYDISQDKLDENQEYIKRTDLDRNVSIQASVGFNF